ncbi:MAG: hypothetical protein ACREE3_11500 [Stellaceae bacterium]
MTGSITGRPIHPAALPAAPAPDSIESFALEWFTRMRSGAIDRTQLVPEYSAQLTDHAVKELSRYMRAYEFGALPLYAEVVRTHKDGDQTFHVVKIVFPRGDAASLMFGRDTAGRVTGMTLLSMAGD